MPPPRTALAISSTPVGLSGATSSRCTRPDDHSALIRGGSSAPLRVVAIRRRDGVASTQSASRAGSSTMLTESTTATVASGSNAEPALRPPLDHGAQRITQLGGHGIGRGRRARTAETDEEHAAGDEARARRRAGLQDVDSVPDQQIALHQATSG